MRTSVCPPTGGHRRAGASSRGFGTVGGTWRASGDAWQRPVQAPGRQARSGRGSSGSKALLAVAWSRRSVWSTRWRSARIAGRDERWMDTPRREVIDIPESAVRVTERAVIARECPVCRRRRAPKVELGGVTMGRQRVGVNVMSLVATLREEARLPIRTRWYLWSVHGLDLSDGAIVGVIHRTAERARDTVHEVRERIRGSPVVAADETGWREGGVNGFVWTFNTPRAVLREAWARQAGGGRGVGRRVWGCVGQRLLRCLQPLRRARQASDAGCTC